MTIKIHLGRMYGLYGMNPDLEQARRFEEAQYPRVELPYHVYDSMVKSVSLTRQVRDVIKEEENDQSHE